MRHALGKNRSNAGCGVSPDKRSTGRRSPARHASTSRVSTRPSMRRPPASPPSATGSRPPSCARSASAPPSPSRCSALTWRSSEEACWRSRSHPCWSRSCCSSPSDLDRPTRARSRFPTPCSGTSSNRCRNRLPLRAALPGPLAVVPNNIAPSAHPRVDRVAGGECEKPAGREVGSRSRHRLASDASFRKKTHASVRKEPSARDSYGRWVECPDQRGFAIGDRFHAWQVQNLGGECATRLAFACDREVSLRFCDSSASRPAQSSIPFPAQPCRASKEAP